MTATRSQVVAEARTWLNTPYRHQGRLKGVSVDCVGLAIGVSQALGLTSYDIEGYARRPDGTLKGEMDNVLHVIGKHEAGAGDLLLFHWANCPMHVGILTGPNSIIHAYALNRKVVEHDLDARWKKQITAAYRIPGVI